MADLTTVERLRRYLGKNDPTDTDDDELLGELVTSASAWFETQTDRKFDSSQAYTDQATGDGSREFVTRNSPLVSVASVSVGGEVIPAQPAPGEPGRYVEGGRILLNQYTFAVGREVLVAYTAGSEVPDDVAQAVTEYAALKYRERGRFSHTAVNVTGEDTQPDQGRSGPSFAAVMSVVNSYRRMSF